MKKFINRIFNKTFFVTNEEKKDYSKDHQKELSSYNDKKLHESWQREKSNNTQLNSIMLIISGAFLGFNLVINRDNILVPHIILLLSISLTTTLFSFIVANIEIYADIKIDRKYSDGYINYKDAKSLWLILYKLLSYSRFTTFIYALVLINLSLFNIKESYLVYFCLIYISFIVIMFIINYVCNKERV